jgi:ribosomal 30S subunit maturation factor RimM
MQNITEQIESSSFEAGKLIKAHGVNGRMVLRLHQPAKDLIDFPEWIYIRINGILVPFQVGEETVFLKDNNHVVMGLEEIADQTAARDLADHSCNLPGEWSDWFLGEADTPASWIGFSILESLSGQHGEITDYQDIPGNPLIEIEIGGKTILVPFNPEYILETNPDKRTMVVRVPDDLMNLK